MTIPFLRPIALASTFLALAAFGQYGTFDPGAVKAARTSTTVVVLDAGDSPYNRMIMNAMKADWKFTPEVEFMTVAELGMQPISPDKTYLMKITKVDPVKYEATFLALMKGWKQKKGENLQVKDNAFTNIPSEQELAYIMIDPKAISEGNMDVMLTVYVKHLQNYLELVQNGKITDKATADRTYAARTRLIRDTELLIARDHLDKSLADEAAVKEVYTSPVRVVDRAELVKAVQAQDRTVTVSDMLLTGEYKTKHCFKRIFNAGTGELMYQGDDASLSGKKEGFIATDLTNVVRAR